MRLLMFHVADFWYRVNEDDPSERGESFGESILVWIHSEAEDEVDRNGVLRKLVKNIRWIANKNEIVSIILHPFAHLGDSKSDSKFAEALIEEVFRKLKDRGYVVHIVPYGFFTEFRVHVKGPSLAKVFKQF
ncbi:MAG: threonyl-tRNA synthetase editing domain-containing protein [Candidatus Thorarchaeota archaeon]